MSSNDDPMAMSYPSIVPSEPTTTSNEANNDSTYALYSAALSILTFVSLYVTFTFPLLRYVVLSKGAIISAVSKAPFKVPFKVPIEPLTRPFVALFVPLLSTSYIIISVLSRAIILSAIPLHTFSSCYSSHRFRSRGCTREGNKGVRCRRKNNNYSTSTDRYIELERELFGYNNTIIQRTNLMACAQTRSGETAAFGLQIIHNFKQKINNSYGSYNGIGYGCGCGSLGGGYGYGCDSHGGGYGYGCDSHGGGYGYGCDSNGGGYGYGCDSHGGGYGYGCDSHGGGYGYGCGSHGGG